MKLKNLKKNIDKIKGKTVFLRTDFNVPISSGKIKEDFKIKQSLETIKFLLKNNCKIILASHLGEAGEVYNSKYSLAPIAKYLSRCLATKINFLNFKKFLDFKTIKKEIKSKNDIFLLDNLRFYPGEKRNCKKLAKSLASLADCYINDAFAVSHRDHSSVSAIRLYLDSYAGLLLEKEILNLNKIFHPQKPFIVIMGGLKISSKLPLIEKLYSKADKILIGGALVNNFYFSQGFNLGDSVVDKNEALLSKKFLKSKKIILASDAIVQNSNNVIDIKEMSKLSDGDKVLDIGPDSILLFSKYIKKAKTIVWNGPMGMFEDDKFKKGTVIIARKIASRAKGRAFALAGGGETVEALNFSGMKNYMDWVSTGGGAMLSYLSGEKMPGLN